MYFKDALLEQGFAKLHIFLFKIAYIFLWTRENYDIKKLFAEAEKQAVIHYSERLTTLGTQLNNDQLISSELCSVNITHLRAQVQHIKSPKMQ